MGESLAKKRPPSFEVFGRQYGATMSTAEAAELLGCSVERLQQQRGQGTLPVEPLQLGKRLRWPTLLVAQALGVELQEPAAGYNADFDPITSARAQRRQHRTHCRPDRPGAA